MSFLATVRLIRIVAPLALAAITLAGCGGKPAAPGVANLGTTTSGAAAASPAGSGGTPATAAGPGGGGVLRLVGGKDIVKFASCMRTHGEPNFPDPDAQGNLSISASSGIDPSSSQFQAAQRACSKYLPSGGQPPSPAQQAKMQQQALRFSACMRAHGVPKFPDPDFRAGKIAIRIDSSSGIDPRSPQFQDAQKACAGELPGKAGPVGSLKAAAGTASPGGK